LNIQEQIIIQASLAIVDKSITTSSLHWFHTLISSMLFHKELQIDSKLAKKADCLGKLFSTKMKTLASSDCHRFKPHHQLYNQKPKITTEPHALTAITANI